MVLTISHRVETGTRVLGTVRNDPAIPVLKAEGWKFRASRTEWYLPRTLGSSPALSKIASTARALMANGVGVVVDVRPHLADIDETPGRALDAAPAMSSGDDRGAKAHIERIQREIRQVRRRLSGSSRVQYTDSYGVSYRSRTAPAQGEFRQGLESRLSKLVADLAYWKEAEYSIRADRANYFAGDIQPGDSILLGQVWFTVQRAGNKAVTVAERLQGRKRTVSYDQILDHAAAPTSKE